jgi:hypothetical protein
MIATCGVHSKRVSLSEQHIKATFGQYVIFPVNLDLNEIKQRKDKKKEREKTKGHGERRVDRGIKFKF